MSQPPSDSDDTTPLPGGPGSGDGTPPPPAPSAPTPPPAEPGYQQPGYQQPPGYGTPPPAYGAPPAAPPGYGQPYPGYPVAPYADPQAKSKIAAGLLGVFLGGFGVHRFYLGYTKIGVIQIIVTVFTCGIGSIWGFVEGILYLVGANGYTTDATGRPLRE